MNYEKRKHACGSFILLPSTFILWDRRVPPGECGFTSSDGDPGTNGVISKTRGGAWNKGQFRVFASEVFGRARPTGAPSPAVRAARRAVLRSPFNHFVRQFGRCRSFREMRGQSFASFLNAFDKSEEHTSELQSPYV